MPCAPTLESTGCVGFMDSSFWCARIQEQSSPLHLISSLFPSVFFFYEVGGLLLYECNPALSVPLTLMRGRFFCHAFVCRPYTANLLCQRPGLLVNIPRTVRPRAVRPTTFYRSHAVTVGCVVCKHIEKYLVWSVIVLRSTVLLTRVTRNTCREHLVISQAS